MSKILNKIGFILIGILVFSGYTYAQTKILSSHLNNSEISIKFDDIPKFTSELSDSKTQIIFNFASRVTPDSNLLKLSNGNINNINLDNYDKHSVLNIYLNEKRGYTNATLPYSNTLLIYTVDWANLASAEDFFHTALLGLDIPDVAKGDLLSSAEAGYNKAGFFLGQLFLKEGKLNSAEQAFLFSLKGDMPFADSYAALSLLYGKKGNDFLAKKYKKVFLELSGQAELKNVVIPNNGEQDSVVEATLAFIVKDSLNPEDFLIQEYVDAKEQSQGTEQAKQDSTKKTPDFLNMDEVFPVWMKFALWIFLATVLLISYFYLKWRQEQLKILQQKQEKLFSKELDNARKKTKKTAKSKTPQKKQTISPNMKKKIGGQNDIVNLYAKNQPTVPNNEEQALKDNDVNAVENFIAGLRPPKEEKEKAKIPPRPKDDIELDLPNMKKQSSGIGANVEMAMNIAQEQQRIRDKNIQNMQKDELDRDREALNRIAKELGVDKGSLETKKALENLSQDSDTFSKLADKFKSNQDDDEEKDE
jgi:hypothetical protein